MVFPLDFARFTEYTMRVGEVEVVSRGVMSKTLPALMLAPATTYYLPDTYARVSEWKEVMVKVLPLVNNIHSFWIEETADGENFFPVEGLINTAPSANTWNKIKTDDLLNYIRVAVRTLDSPNPVPATLVIVLEVRR